VYRMFKRLGLKKLCKVGSEDVDRCWREHKTWMDNTATPSL
jgi:hypothetical protein